MRKRNRGRDGDDGRETYEKREYEVVWPVRKRRVQREQIRG